MLERMLPVIDIPFISASGRSDEACRALLRHCMARGAQFAVVMRGKAGAMALSAARPSGFIEQPATACRVLDTLGAGDGFIAATLVGLLRQEPPEQILWNAAVYAAEVCGWFGAFGHGQCIEEGDTEATRMTA